MKEKKNSQKESKQQKDNKKECFIIMPISTPMTMLEKYAGGKDHFEHVLNQLFIPAIEKLDLKPISPSAKGSDLIHGEIIKNIENADIVLCDMSSLNPNVFFEFGIRTSLNKPVALVVDDMTPKIPFDTTIIHYHKYRSGLQNWTHDEDISLISNHINDCLSRSAGKNALWKYFGLSSIAQAAEIKEGEDPRMDYLIMQVESLKDKIEEEKPTTLFDPSFAQQKSGVISGYSPEFKPTWPTYTSNLIMSSQDRIEAAARALDISDFEIYMSIGGGYTLRIKEKISEKTRKKLKDLMKEWAIKLNIIEE